VKRVKGREVQREEKIGRSCAHRSRCAHTRNALCPQLFVVHRCRKVLQRLGARKGENNALAPRFRYCSHVKRRDAARLAPLHTREACTNVGQRLELFQRRLRVNTLSVACEQNAKHRRSAGAADAGLQCRNKLFKNYLISYLEIRYCELPPELVERDLARLLKANARPLGGEDREWERAAEVN